MMAGTILVTGATGYLGSHLVNRLVGDGYDVVILKRSFSDTNRIDGVLKSLKYYDIDKIDVSVPFGENNIDTVIHLATNYGRSGESVSEVFKDNLIFAIRLLEETISHNVGIFINTDTCLPRHINSYTLTKKQFVDWLKFYKGRLCIFNLRLEYFYGPGDDDTKFVTHTLRELLAERDTIPLSAGEQERDFVFVDDVVDAYCDVLLRAEGFPNGFHQFEIGSGKTVTLKKLVIMLKELAENEKTVLDFGKITYRDNEAMYSCADITAMKESFSWLPKTELIEGLNQTVLVEQGLKRNLLA